MPNWIRKTRKSEEAIRAKRNRERQRNYDRGRTDMRNNFEPYTYEECERIINHDISDRELAKEIGRSVEAIQNKRNRLMLVQNRLKGAV